MPKPPAPRDPKDNHTRRVGKRGLAIVETLAAEGNPDVKIAQALRLNRHTFREIRKRQPEVQEALDRGRGELELELTDLLLKSARKGNTVAQIFLLKGRCGWREGESPASSPADRVNVTINLPGSLSREDFENLVDITPQPDQLPAPEGEV